MGSRVCASLPHLRFSESPSRAGKEKETARIALRASLVGGKLLYQPKPAEEEAIITPFLEKRRRRKTSAVKTAGECGAGLE